MTGDSKDDLTIWCLMDGKAGHQNQALGFAEALSRQASCQIHRVELKGWNRSWWALTGGKKRLLPTARPDLIVGAGHATHIPLCVFRRRFGGQSVVLMKPTLPMSLFDVCLIPEVHNLKSVPANVILTRGVLNRIRPNGRKDGNTGIFLIGGPSTHYRWADDEIFQQVKVVLESASDVNWKIVTSRRTPQTFCDLVSAANLSQVLIQPDDVDSNWLLSALSATENVWVSEDSVSMTYEALTSGAAVGILQLRRYRNNRVTECIDTLVNANSVTHWSKWRETGVLARQAEPFCEAERCARKFLTTEMYRSIGRAA